MISKYITIKGGAEKTRASSLHLSINGLKVIGNLPHGYEFVPESKEDAQALIDYLQQWIENN